MAVVYSIPVRNARLQQVVDAIDAGAGSGILKIGTAGMALILSNIILSKPCATIAAGVLTFANLPLTDPSAILGGTATEGEITDSSGNVVISGLTVGLAGADLIISATNINAGDTVSFISGTITGS